MSHKFPVCQLLPKDARDALVAASKRPYHERQVAIDETVARIKRKYPQFFRQLKEYVYES